MTTVYIARATPWLVRSTQARLEAARDMRVLGVADSLACARAGLARHDADTLLIDLRLVDGASQALIRELREQKRYGERPKVMAVAGRVDDPLLFPTLVAGADAYLLEADLAVAPSALQRLAAGEAAMAAAIALRVLRFFNESASSPVDPDDRRLDWDSQAGNPLRLSPGERRLLQLLAGGARSSELALRFGVSLEAVGRRIGNVYRKLSWDVRSGALTLQAA